MEGADLRAVARCCRDLSNECFDLTVAGKLRRLADSLEAAAREADEAGQDSRAAPFWSAAGRWVRQIRLPFRVPWRERLRGSLRAHGARQ